jgi:hypothetical protein
VLAVKLLRETIPEYLTPASFLDAVVGNRLIPGVEDSGFYQNEQGQDRPGPFRWTDGHAKLVIPLDRNDLPQAMLVQLDRPTDRFLRITVNNQELVNEKANQRSPRAWEKTLDLSGIELGDKIVVEIVSNTTVPGKDSRTLGVQVRGIKLLRAR